MLNDRQIKKIVNYSKEIHSKLELTHDLEHIQRVVELAIILARKERANIKIVQAAAWLHDIGYLGLTKKEMIEKNHPYLSAEMARKFLNEIGIKDNVIDIIYNCILSHSTSRIKDDDIIEAKCIHDADKLDCLGIRGFIRMFMWDLTVEPKDYNNISDYIKHLEVTVKRKESMLKTNTAKSIAKKRNESLFKLLREYKEEMFFLTK